MATLKDVAKAARVSTVTASSVLSGANRVRVSQKTVARILGVARDLNYVPRAAARGLRTGRIHAIGFVTAAHRRSHWHNWQEILRGISDVLFDRDEQLVLSLPATAEQEVETLRRLTFGHRVDGLIIQDAMLADRRLTLLREAGLPHVVIGGENLPDCHQVAFDMSKFARLIAMHLLARVAALAVVAAPPQTEGERDFLASCRAAASERGQPYAEWTGAFLPESNWFIDLRRYCDQRPLGIILARHLLPEMLAALNTAGIPLGRDALILYLAGSEEVALVPAGLEIIHLDYYTLGRRAAKLLFKLIDNKESTASASRILVLPGMAEEILVAEKAQG